MNFVENKLSQKYLKILSLLFALVVSILIFVFKNQILNLQGYGYFGLFLLNILGSATIFLPTPLFLTAFAASTFLNPFLVAIVSSMGSSVGEVTGYMIGYGGEGIIEKNKNFRTVKKWTDKYGLWALFVLAAIPNPFFDIAGIIAGYTEISISKFLIVVWLGKLVKFGFIVFLGVNSIGLLSKFI